MDGIGGSGLGSLIQSGFDSIQNQSASLKAQMSKVADPNFQGDKTTAMIELQFQVGQYNTMVELTSSITKSLSDSIKSVSQKI